MSFGKPRRLEFVFQKYDPPVYFVTLCTMMRRNFLANQGVHLVLTRYGEVGAERGYAIGRYVIMPDHIHLFVRGTIDFKLGNWIGGLKRVVAAAVTGGRGFGSVGSLITSFGMARAIRKSGTMCARIQFALASSRTLMIGRFRGKSS